ncbi:MAG TPA: biotin-dependent carboxyltransferase family protein [Chitinophagaceae bacterium]|nr:biotin-dependent carboxyltransferase family protein [Chitinophagaceae bacterium]
MSLQIIKSGLLDSIQDKGRHGYQHLGINPGGAMDSFSTQAGNALLGKDLYSPVIEIHFPASVILFEKETIICITGADFSPVINQKKIPIDQPIVVNKNSVLQFEKKESGARCYLAVLHKFDLDKWLNSYSTNLVAGAGGFKGRALKIGDIIHFKNNFEYKYLAKEKDLSLLPWKTISTQGAKKEIRFIKGPEWDWLTNDAQKVFAERNFQILNNSNRMGYHLKGNSLKLKEDKQLISSGVTFGTIQLLPNGQMIVLMADHQTTGGYPRIAQIISADLPLLAQRNPGDEIKFYEVEHDFAEQQLIEQHMQLVQLQNASKFKMEKILL